MKGRRRLLAAAGARLSVALCLLLGSATLGASAASGATLPELEQPSLRHQSTPLCSPECEVIDAPLEPASGLEYEGGGPGGGFTPQELQAAYGLSGHGGGAATVAVIDGRGAPEAEADLAHYREEFGLPACTAANGCFRQLDEFGEPRHPTSSGSWSGEISLDLDMVSAACPECRIDLFEGAGPVGLREAISTAVEMGATVVTNSWNLGFEESNPANRAICEVEICVSQAEEEIVDRDLDHPGVPILFSGGDYGYGVRFPAASPHVISVGGTRLLRDAGSPRGWSEEVWSNTAYGANMKGRGTGSGCSVFEAKPSWETDTACTKRIENDVSAVADPRSPVAVYNSELGGWRLSGGTSASAPFVAGVEAISSAGARRLGAQGFWEAGEAGSLFDVTVGNDGECIPPAEDSYWCAAGVGFDAPTGWGTPNGPLVFESPPTAHTAGVTDQSQETATLHGTVDNQGNPGPSSCAFQIAHGWDTGFSEVLATVPCEPGSIAGEGPQAVRATAANLSPRTVYAYRVVAGNSDRGPVFSSAETFRTLPDPPAVTTGSAAAIGRDRATLEAVVDNNGAFDGSACSFRVVAADDPTFAAPYTTVPCSPETVEEEGGKFVSGEISGLTLNTPYLFRVEATNEGGPVVGDASAFRTLPNTPVVSTGAASSETSSGAVLAGLVNNEGAPDGSECFFEVAPISAPKSAQPILMQACEPTLVYGEQDVAVSATVTGLSPATEYMFRVRAKNAGGEATWGSYEPFATAFEPPPEPEPEREPLPITVPLIERTPPSNVIPNLPPPSPSNVFTLGRATAHAGAILLSVTVPGPGILKIAGAGAVTQHYEALAAGSPTIRIALTPTERRRAGRDPNLRVRLTVDFTPDGGTAAAKTVSVLVGRRPTAR